MDKIGVRTEIVRYSPEMSGEWNEFLKRARNSTFLFNRGYLDYHSDRYEDCSWLVYRNGKLRALLPANISSQDGLTLHSHAGLTYGGWVLPTGHLDGADLLTIFSTAIERWKQEGIRAVDYKPLPTIYSTGAAQDDLYALFRLGARCTGCGLSTAIELGENLRFNQMQRRHLKNTSLLDWEIREEADVTQFMKMLVDCLRERHETTPVHNSTELQLLRDRFPENIRIFCLRTAGNSAPDAGVCIYDTGKVAHVQYIATTEKGRKYNFLTPIFAKLIDDIFAERKWFDFGISTENNGEYLNSGLLQQKCSYGGAGVVYPRFRLDL